MKETFQESNGSVTPNKYELKETLIEMSNTSKHTSYRCLSL